jgi:hypothetical protein
VKHSVEVLIPDKLAFDQYLAACEEKLAAEPYSRMRYPFPSLKESCSLCGGANCAHWRGYQTRLLFCSDMEVRGPILIHVGRCKKTGSSFQATPSFLSTTGG